MKFILVTLFAYATIILNAQYIPNFQKHTVKQGETAKTISAKYKVSLSDFCLLNDFPNDVRLSTGQVVLIRQLNPGETYLEDKPTTPATTTITKPAPARTETAPSVAKPVTAKTETSTPKAVTKLESVELKPTPTTNTPAVTTPSTLIEKPVVTKADFTGPGGVKYESTNDGYHTVRTGQTFYRIALINGLTVDELKALNKLTNTNIEVGQKLRVK